MPYLRHTEVDEIAAASREVARRVMSEASLFQIGYQDLKGLTFKTIIFFAFQI